MKCSKIIAVLIGFLLANWSFAQESALDLSIDPEDTRVVPAEGGGFDLFIRNRGAVSILLTEFTRAAIEEYEELYGYRADAKNSVNGNEGYIEYGSRIFKEGGIWFLVDSTPEPYLFDGEAEEQAYHIFLPPVVYYGYHNTRAGVAYAKQGLYINIRCFSKPRADIRSSFADNFFVLMLDAPKGPRLERFSSNKEYVQIEESPSPQIEEEPPEEPVVQVEEPPEEPPALQVEELLIPQVEAPSDKEKPFLLEAEGGFMYFTPGKAGKNLQNTMDFPARLFLKAPFFEKWGIIIGYERDFILLNRLFARAVFDLGFFNIATGLAMGFLNFDSSTISLAFSTTVFAQSQNGRLFGSLGIDLPFDGAQKNSTFPYKQTSFTLDTGIRLPYIIFSFHAFLSVMLLRDEKEVYDVAYITSKQALYALTIKTDFATANKGKGFDFSLTAGYRDVNRSVRALLLSEPYQYSSFFGGLGLFVSANRNFGLYMKAEAPFYPWVFNPLPAQSDAFLLTASLGFTLRFGKP
jgi:hypothetical protein